jgi:hypothetical protein
MSQKVKKSEIKKARKAAVQKALKAAARKPVTAADEGRTFATVTSRSFETNGYSAPQVCPCCLKPTRRQSRITWTSRLKKYNTGVRRVTVQESKSAPFYVCQECDDHKEKYRKTSQAITGISFVLNTAGMLLVMPVIKDMGLSTFTTALSHLSAVLSGAMLATLIAGLVCRLKNPLPPGHINWDWFVGFSVSGFKFANVDYAKLFKETNTSPFVEARGIEMSVETELFNFKFTGRYLPGQLVF